MHQGVNIVGSKLVLFFTATLALPTLVGCGGSGSPPATTNPPITRPEVSPTIVPRDGGSEVTQKGYASGGKAILSVYASGTIGFGCSVYVFLNGRNMGSAVKDESREFSFEIAKDGRNDLKIKTVLWEGTTNEKAVQFAALPGSVTNATVKIGSGPGFQNTAIDLGISAE